MAKGTTAKENVEKKIASAFGEDYIGNFDKKLYVWANDGGERVQIAISLTCPKVLVGGENAASNKKGAGDYDFTEESTDIIVTPKAQVEVTQEEQQNLADLLAKFGL